MAQSGASSEATEALAAPARVEATVAERREIAPGFVRLRLTLSVPGALPPLCAGQHLKIFAPNVCGSVPGEWNGRPDPEYGLDEVERRYTPVASNWEEGWLELVVELITAARAPPDGGKFGRFVADLTVGATVGAAGPHGVYRYLGARRFARRGGATGPTEEVWAENVAMVCAGVAANTVMALASALAREPADTSPRVWLVVAGRTEDTLLHREALEQLATDHPGRFHVWFVLEKSTPPEWPYGSGSLTEALLPARMPPAGGSTLLLTMGSGKVKQACGERLSDLGYEGGGATWWHWNEELD